MIDIKLLQKDFDAVSTALLKKGVDSAILDDLKVKSEVTKTKRQEMESLQASQNALSSQFGAYKKEGKDINELKAQIDELKKTKTAIELDVKDMEEI